jgi:hypothetical protein
MSRLPIVLFALSWIPSAFAADFRETHRIESCRTLDGAGEDCVWNLALGRERCPGDRCPKLVVFFQGADMGCQRTEGLQKRRLGALLDRYAHNGYLAVTACLFETLKGANAFSVGAQVPRADALVKAITSHPSVRRHWSGEHLLLAGVSLGATTPVVAMARSEIDDEARWKGSRTTAACFHDGVYDLYETDRFFWENRRSCSAQRKRSLCARYEGVKRCPYPLRVSEEATHDSSALAGAEELSVSHWKLVECGSRIEKPKCALHGDWIPAGPIEALCSKLARSPAHECEWDPQPWDSHLSCAFTPAGIDRCRTWFDGLTAAP